MTDTDPAGDDSLDLLRVLGRTLVALCAFLVLAMATLVVGNVANESFSLMCADSAPDRSAVSRVFPDVRLLPPRLVCTTTDDGGVASVKTLPLAPRTTAVFAALTVGWLAAGVFVIAVLARPSRVRLLDRATATSGLGVVTGLVLLRIVISVAKRQAESTPAPLPWMPRGDQPEWLFPAVVVSVILGAAVAAARTRRPRWIVAAALATAFPLWLYLIVSTAIHPLRLTLPGSVGAGIAGAAAGHVLHAQRRLKASRNATADTDT